jgi:hypothetical protein
MMGGVARPTFMTRIYFYKLTADNGGAPHVHRGWLSLAICKPQIRKKAKEGDLIFGFAANSLHKDNRLIYAARVTKNLSGGSYYGSKRYARRGDCIYRFSDDRLVWRKGARYHGPNDVSHDLGEHPFYERANVLLSGDFRYFGKNGTAEYKSKFSEIKYAVEHLSQGHRVRQKLKLRNELLKMKEWIWRTTRKEETGTPTSAPSRRICYRIGPCKIV